MADNSGIDALIERYATGAALLRDSLGTLSEQQLTLSPIEGQWSFAQVICHIADFETINADRMKRIIAEDNPALLNADENRFAVSLFYERRSVAEELDLITAQRAQMTRILRSLDVECFQRTGVHSEDGPMTLERILERTTRHIPHHIEFIRAKQQTM